MRRHLILSRSLPQVALASVLFLAAPAAAAAAPARQAVLAQVDALFAAMASHDVAAARRLLVPGAAFAVRRPGGEVQIEHDSQFLDALGTSKGVWRERIWTPRVIIRGDLAQVVAPYDFHLDGVFSHCGIDSFSLLRNADGWRIAGISYTVKKTGCAPSPLDKPTD